MSSHQDEDFFIGWAPTSKSNRRLLLTGGISLMAGGIGLMTLLASAHEPVGKGQWDQSQTVNLTGMMVTKPWPHLLIVEQGRELKTVFLVGSGKQGLSQETLLPDGALATATGSIIKRGSYAMMAISGLKAHQGNQNDTITHAQPKIVNEAPVLLSGEILDAKCWFGAMRPSSGKVHKACASLCVRGRLPVAFCSKGCGDEGDLMVFVRPDGTAHDQELLPFVADPVAITGRIVRVNNMKQLRADISDIRYL
jgi:hypothetical protein